MAKHEEFVALLSLAPRPLFCLVETCHVDLHFAGELLCQGVGGLWSLTRGVGRHLPECHGDRWQDGAVHVWAADKHP